MGRRRSVNALRALLAVSVLSPAAVGAQGGPVFELQPGLAVNDFVSVPEGTQTNTAFSLRFATRFPTGTKWLTPVVGALFLPYGSTENTIRNTDAPTIFAGNIFSLVDGRDSGWITLEVPVLIAHGPGTGSTGNVRDYGRDLVVIPTVYVHLGTRALRELGTIWSRFDLFATLEQTLTPNPNPASGRRDFFNPIATLGMSVSIAGARD